MLNEFLFNVEIGVSHVLDINAYDHVLFLMVLTIPYMFKDWKRVITLVSLFTLGHTLSLVLAAYNVVAVSGVLVEFLIPITILVMAVYNIFTAGKGAQKERIGLLFLTSLFFGLIHGLGFAKQFHMLADGSTNKLILLLEFALGIEIAQIIIVFIVLFVGYVIQTIFRFSKRDWVMVLSSIVVGLVIPMLLGSAFLKS
jgi:hypothetical protein